jgi:hypothetical protein
MRVRERATLRPTIISAKVSAAMEDHWEFPGHALFQVVMTWTRLQLLGRCTIPGSIISIWATIVIKYLREKYHLWLLLDFEMMDLVNHFETRLLVGLVSGFLCWHAEYQRTDTFPVGIVTDVTKLQGMVTQNSAEIPVGCRL